MQIIPEKDLKMRTIHRYACYENKVLVAYVDNKSIHVVEPQLITDEGLKELRNVRDGKNTVNSGREKPFYETKA